MAYVSEQCQHQLTLFKRQYLQLQVDIRYPDPAYLRQEIFQEALRKQVFDEDSIEYQPPHRYQIRVLKELIKRIEDSVTDCEEQGILDGLICRLSTLLTVPLPPEAVSAQQRSYITYTLSSICQNKFPPTITLLEVRNLLAATGTTGFRTWDACLHLGAYLCSPSCIVPITNQCVLELGAGTGYLSILCAKHLYASHVTVTDGSETIIAELATNFFLNGLQESSVIEAKELKWGQALLGGEQAEWNQGRSIDVVLGADVTYDSRGIPALVGTLVDLVEMFPATKILIAATIRNEETFGNFVMACEVNGFKVEEIDYPVPSPANQEGPFHRDGIPIRLCGIKKNQIIKSSSH